MVGKAATAASLLCFAAVCVCNLDPVLGLLDGVKYQETTSPPNLGKNFKFPLETQGYRLKEIFVHSGPSKLVPGREIKLTRHVVPEEVHKKLDGQRNPGRKLVALSDMSKDDKALFLAGLCILAYPGTYFDLSNEGLSIFANGDGLISGSSQTVESEEFEALQLEALGEATTFGDWTEIHSVEADPFTDPDDHLSCGMVYATLTSFDQTETIVVFRGSYSDCDYDVDFLWYNDWVIEKQEDALINMWTDAGQTVTDAMKQNQETNSYDEDILVREGTLFNADFTLVNDLSGNGVSDEDIKKFGYWPLTKTVFNEIKSNAGNSAITLTGHGQGGARAALVSMWQKKSSNKEYKTVAISAPGTSCMGRHMAFNDAGLTDDVDPFTAYSFISVYRHVLDPYAHMDYPNAGEVCTFGTRGAAYKNAVNYCSKIIGYPGSVIAASCQCSNDLTTSFSCNEALCTAQKDCRHLTNSVFSSYYYLKDKNSVCSEVDLSVPEDDPDGLCPTGDYGTSTLVNESLAVALACTVFGLVFVVCICICKLKGLLCFKDEDTEFGKDVALSPSSVGTSGSGNTYAQQELTAEAIDELGRGGDGMAADV